MGLVDVHPWVPEHGDADLHYFDGQGETEQPGPQVAGMALGDGGDQLAGARQG